ncbi:MAG: type II toxin-antitoxin system VapC family toxin [Anaerolineales bacterium]
MTQERSSWDCVVDASVAIKIFVIEPLTERADRLFAHLSDDPPARFYVPELFFIECANILWKYVRRFGYAIEDARRDVADLVRLPLQVASMAALAGPALDLATTYESTAYDAAYVALAGQLHLPLVTADESLVRCYQDTELVVRSLADFVAL